MPLIRLNQHLKNLGICSRRKADEFISQGLIKVNNEIVTTLGLKIDPTKDKITFLQQLTHIIQNYHYFLLYKPVGYVCSKNDIEGKTIYHLLPKINNLSYAGRLDKDSEGLIILSDNGKFIYSISGKEFLCEKEYIVTVNKPITPIFLNKLSDGSIILDTKKVRKCQVHQINKFTYSIVLTEGINRQIRRMSKICGYQVISLKRIRIGKLTAKDLQVGHYKTIQPTDVIEKYL